MAMLQLPKAEKKQASNDVFFCFSYSSLTCSGGAMEHELVADLDRRNSEQTKHHKQTKWLP
jgi:hypothetical protein